MYAVETSHGSLVSTTGEPFARMFFGPGTDRSVKTWKTRQGADRFAGRINGRVIELNAQGEEIDETALAADN